MTEHVSLSKHSHGIQSILSDLGLSCRVVEFPASTKTSQEAATAIGCEIGQIAKSIIFRTKTTKQPVFVLASGPNRISEKLIEAQVGEKIEKADAEFVKEKTGYTIGGIPPLGHKETISHVFIDQDLLQFSELWAAAGTGNSVFSIQSENLATMVPHGKVIAVY